MSVSLLEAARSIRPLIEEEAERIEAECTMTRKVVDAIEAAGLFELIVPRAYGGHEADVATVVDVCEELSFADGSVGWAHAQNTTVMGYSAYLAPEFARPLADAAAAAGMFAPLGVANKVDGGFQVSGSYAFGSGAGHAEYMGGAAMVMIDGEMAPFVGALPQMIAFIVPADRVNLKGNWDVMGLRGTGSFDFEVPDQFVDTGQTFSVFDGAVIEGGPIYGIGPIVLGTISSAAWAIGVARRALHEIAELGKGGRTRLGSLPLVENPTFQRDYGLHLTAVDAARLLVVEAYQAAVDAVADGAPEDEFKQRIRETKSASSYATHVAKAATTFAWESSGSAGMRNPSRLQRCFRDIYVGSGHQVFDDRNYNEVAKPRLGVEPAIF